MLNKIFFVIVLLNIALFGQSNIQPIDIFIIDSFITPEAPYMVKISFFTSEKVKSEITFKGNRTLTVSDSLSEDHSFSVPLMALHVDSSAIEYVITVFDKDGNKTISEPFEMYLEENSFMEFKHGHNIYKACLGALTFFIPAPTLVFNGGSSYFSLSKEFPVISFFSSGYNFPSSYLSLEYSYVFNSPNSNYLRVGYKYIFETDILKYVSPGINYTTNFNGFNGVSPEITFGLIKFYETFTLYARYRYNIKPGNSSENFSDISIGLFTSVISFWF